MIPARWLLPLIIVASVPAAETWNWRNVRLGGGGAITTIITHPKVPGLAYLGCDVTGPARWDEAAQRWTPLFNWIPRTTDWLYGVEGMCVDPSDTSGNYVYVAAGNRSWSGSGTVGEILRSSDRGATWARSGPGYTVWASSNSEQLRSMRLAVDPANPAILYHAGRKGLWWHQDCRGDLSTGWSAVTAAPTGLVRETYSSTKNESGAVLICIDSRAGTVASPTRSRRMYLGVLNADGSNIDLHATEDGGATWVRIDNLAGGPVKARRADLDSLGRLYVSHGSGLARWSGGTAGTWTNVSPAGASACNAIAVDPGNDQTVIAASHTYGFGNTMYRSTNAGASWTAVSTTKVWDPSWYETSHFGASIFSFAIDPFDSRRVWFADWYLPWRTEDITAQPSTWRSRVTGHEELVLVGSGVVSPPGGRNRVLVTVADEGGLCSADPDQFPDIQVWRHGAATGLQSGLNVTGMDYQESHPDTIAAACIFGWSGGGNGQNGGFSTDGGLTWTRFDSTGAGVTLQAGRIAVAASGTRMVWAAPQGVFHGDMGATVTWTKATGAPASACPDGVFTYCNPLAADRKTAGRFWLYNSGNIHRSVDGGVSWTICASGFTSSNYDNRVYANPETAGEVWFCVGGTLRRSVDAGTTFSAVSTMTAVKQFGFGKGASPGTPALYAYGKVNNVAGIHLSDDLGASWRRIDTPAWQIGNVDSGANGCNIAGDRQTYGHVYVSSTGSGAFVGSLVPQVAPIISQSAQAIPGVLVLP
jgi:xyloglucan-specific exo-beta-1,4-glucanase